MADPGLIALLLNAVDWLGQSADLASIRAKSLADPPLDLLTPLQRAEDDEREALIDEQTAQTGAEAEEAEERAEEARDRRQAAEDALSVKKNIAKFGNMFGIPLFFALFGLLRWRMRQARKGA